MANRNVRDAHSYKPNELALQGKRQYSAPRLICYGSVTELTAGGSGNASENNNGMGMSRPRP
jgi:hypothetical protein